MGSKDYRWREPKKPKKGGKKIEPVTILPQSVEVEVIGKRKKKREEEAVEEEAEE